MYTVCIYTRHKLNNFACGLKLRLESDYKTFVFSEDDIGDVRVISLEKYFSTFDASLFLTDDEIIEIISRCRVLRSIKYNCAIKLIRRAYGSIDKMIAVHSPDIIISPRIDDYFLDILERFCKVKNIHFLGLWRSAFISNNFFLTARGEYHSVRIPHSNEVDLFISRIRNSSFKATSIQNKKYSPRSAVQRYLFLYLRACILEVIRRFSKNKFRYREMATRFFVKEYRVSFFQIFHRYSNWDKKLAEVQKTARPKIFLALQVNPESTIDYYCTNTDLIDISTTTPKIIKLFIDFGYDVIVKDHPNMSG